MNLSEVIPREQVYVVEDQFADKTAALKHLFDLCVAGTPLEEHRQGIWHTLLEREQSMSTGIGLGVAIPHCSSEHVSDVHGLIAVLKHELDFDSVDESPVRIVVLLLMPKKRFERHIKVLATIARVFNDEDTRARVLAASDPDAVFEIVTAGVAEAGSSSQC